MRRREPPFSIRKGDWIMWESNDKFGPYGKLLFNLTDDLSEATTLAPEHPEKVKELPALCSNRISPEPRDELGDDLARVRDKRDHDRTLVGLRLFERRELAVDQRCRHEMPITRR